jgi:hypothetical protein
MDKWLRSKIAERVGMQKWQSGVWVESCENVKYPHYCGIQTKLDKEPSEFFEKRVKKAN